MRRGLGLAAFIAFLSWLSASPAYAHPAYALSVPNPVTALGSTGVVQPCTNCHNNPDGGAGCAMMPCLNPFGMAFRTNTYRWDAALAGMDSDGDGFTNGQELQDALGAWMIGDPDPGRPAYHTPPGNPSVHPGQFDDDNDRYCYFGRDTNMDGDCSDSGENNGSFDCDDGAATANSGATELCSNVADDDCDGLPTVNDDQCIDYADRDGDGRCPKGRDMNADRNCGAVAEMTSTIVDCDDTRANVHLDARENCADTIDNDCDSDIDLVDVQCQGNTDEDFDGYCPVGRDNNGDHDCLDGAAEVDSTVGDCDDTDPQINPGKLEDDQTTCQDGIDNECDGTADFNDTECFAFRDADGDGYCTRNGLVGGGLDLDMDGDCADEGETTTASDCDDADERRSPGLLEQCREEMGVDEDCDGFANLLDLDGSASSCNGYLDTDGDGYCYVGPDRDSDGKCTLPTEFGGRSDCDDANDAVSPVAIEICTDGNVDNDCDGSPDAADPQCAAYVDVDRDGYCETGSDGNGDYDCTDADEPGSVVDAAPTDPTIYPGAPENCVDEKDNDQNAQVDADDAQCVSDRDADMDGYCPLGRDYNGDGDCEDESENVFISDCNDDDDTFAPDAIEDCGDFHDNDCDSDIDLFDADCFRLLDRDGDGFCGTGVDDNRDGDCLDEAEDRFGEDCDDGDADVNARATEVCDNAIDDDCDGEVDAMDSTCGCMSDEDCDDEDECTVDMCVSRGHCDHVRSLCVDGGTGDDDDDDDDGGPGDDDDGEEDEGCSCRAARTSSGSGWWAAVLVLGAVWVRRRRRAGARASGRGCVD